MIDGLRRSEVIAVRTVANATLQWAWQTAGRKIPLDRNFALKQRAGSSFVNAMSMQEHYRMTVEFPTR
jgi:hypothetical protein